jgi:hypothetical protein
MEMLLRGFLKEISTGESGGQEESFTGNTPDLLALL